MFFSIILELKTEHGSVVRILLFLIIEKYLNNSSSFLFIGIHQSPVVTSDKHDHYHLNG